MILRNAAAPIATVLASLASSPVTQLLPRRPSSCPNAGDSRRAPAAHARLDLPPRNRAFAPRRPRLHLRPGPGRPACPFGEPGSWFPSTACRSRIPDTGGRADGDLPSCRRAMVSPACTESQRHVGSPSLDSSSSPAASNGVALSCSLPRSPDLAGAPRRPCGSARVGLSPPPPAGALPLAARGRSGCPADDGWERKRTRGRSVVVQEAGRLGQKVCKRRRA